MMHYLPCPECKAKPNEWCHDVLGGPTCKLRFDLWVAMGRPELDECTDVEPLVMAMMLAAHGS